jgi:antirestriction protein ArdC
VRAPRKQIEQEAPSRAATGQSLSNWPAILAGFTAKGIAEADIKPRENVFTYHAWWALGRQVRKGEHGVKVATFVSTRGKEDKHGVAANDADWTDKPKRGAVRRPWTATVFHVSQTDPIQPARMPIGHTETAACANSGL